MEVTIRSCANGYSVVWREFNLDGTCKNERRSISPDLPSVLAELVLDLSETHQPFLNGDVGTFIWRTPGGEDFYTETVGGTLKGVWPK